MNDLDVRKTSRLAHAAQCTALLAAGFTMMCGLSGCLVAGYSSRGGAFIWPGSFGFLILLLVLWFLLRRR